MVTYAHENLLVIQILRLFTTSGRKQPKTLKTKHNCYVGSIFVFSLVQKSYIEHMKSITAVLQCL